MKQCKKHDKESECGDCGMKFFLVPKEEQISDNWEEELQFEVMEDYLLDAEMSPGALKNQYMREHFDKLKNFIKQTLAKQKEEERQFILNILDGIDKADEEMGNKSGGTLAIRLALKSRIL